MIKLKPLLDNYAGSYRDRYRFWSGVLIGVRFPLYMLFASTDSINIRLLGIAIAVVLYCLLLGSLSVYKNWSRLVLELFFHLNLLTITVTYLFDPSPQTSLPVYAIVQIGIGCAFVCFVAIFIARIVVLMREKITHGDALQVQIADVVEPQALFHAIPDSSQLREPLISGTGHY